MAGKTTISKDAIIKAISLKTGYSQSDIKAVLDTLADVIADGLRDAAQGDIIEVPSIVRFKKAMSPAVKERKQYNALLKKNVVIPARVPETTVRPYATKMMKEAVKG